MQIWPEPPSKRQGHQHDGIGTSARSLANLYSTGADPAGVENAEGALAACRRQHLANRAI
jgi:hypothetical protein